MTAKRRFGVAALVLAACAASAAGQFRGPVTRPVGTPAGGSSTDPAAVGGGGAAPKDLHLSGGRAVSFNYQLIDSGGFNWDIQQYGAIGQGTQYIYSGGLHLQIAGDNFRHTTGQATASADGREIELGPWNRNGLNVYRRVRVYDNLPLCRWLEIFENPSGAPVTVQMQLRTSCNANFTQITTNTGANQLGAKDWAFMTLHADGPGRPSLLHVIGSDKSKARPGVQVAGNTILVNWTLTIAPRSTAVLCHFQSQGQQPDFEKLLKGWKLNQVLADLSPALRRLIVNMSFPSLFDESLQVERSGLADRLELDNGDVLLGTLANAEYRITTAYGQFALPAARVIGLVGQTGRVPTFSVKDGVLTPIDQPPAGDGTVFLLLSDGQVLRGHLAEPVLRLGLSTGGELRVPVERLRQCGYRVTNDKPAELLLDDPMLVLRAGDRLAFESPGPPLSLTSPHGTIELPPASLLNVDLDVPDGGVHRVFFRNGSRLGGIVGPENCTFRLGLGTELTIDRSGLRRVLFALQADEERPDLAHATLRNDDLLLGQLTDERIELRTAFGDVTIEPMNIAAMAFDAAGPDPVLVRLWDGTTSLRGRLASPRLGFALDPDGPALALDVAYVQGLACPAALPPRDMVQRIERLIAQLGSNVFADRNKAMEELAGMGEAAVPLLRRHLNDPDPEIRQRVKGILEKTGGSSAAAPPAPDTPEMMMPRRAIMLR